jgi:hypothetical protein
MHLICVANGILFGGPITIYLIFGVKVQKISFDKIMEKERKKEIVY